ncbi:MAG: hypothetical protein ACXWUB_11440, partial [Burkholderiales bacterium]
HALLLRRLHLLRGEGAGFTGLAGEAVSEHGQLAWLENELAVNEQNLTTVASGPEGLEYQLERLCAVLANPQKHFFITPRRLRLDRMNVLLDEHSAMPGAWLDLKIARIPMPDGSAESRSVVLVRFPRAALLPRSALVSDAGRMVR